MAHRLVTAPGRGWQMLFGLWCPTLLPQINTYCHTSNLMPVCGPDVKGSILLLIH